MSLAAIEKEAPVDGTSVLHTAARWRAEGRKVALATVVETWGSSPRPAGAMLAIDDEGRFEGSVSGGCIEGDIVAEAQALLASDAPRGIRLLSFGVSNSTAWAVGLACGGSIRILLETVEDGA